MPAAWMICVATGLEDVTMREFFSPKWEGICRAPLLGSARRAKTEYMKSSAVIPMAMQKARSR